MKAMILAAGYGTRLFPLTIDRTKPAIPLLGKPLVGYVAEYLAGFGIREVAVNLHHQPESVKSALGDGSEFGVRIHYTYESPQILGTAGALDNARDFLEDGTFVIINGKIITDIDLARALETHKRTGAMATMVLQKNRRRERFSEVYVDEGSITGFGDFPAPVGEDPGNVPNMYTGIQILEPGVFEYIPRNAYSDIVPTFYNPAIRNKEKIIAHFADGKWFELSTIPRYLEISLRMLNGAKRKTVIGKNTRIADSANIEESVLWDNVIVGNEARIKRSIIGDDVVIRDGERYEDVAVVSREMLRHCDEIPEKALKGRHVGDNYVVSLLQ